MSYVIQAVLSNAQHPEYGQVTIPFPIPNQNYDCTIELLEPLEIGDMASFLSYAWISTESPNNDPNLSQRELLSMFRSLDPQKLMDQEEYTQFQNLDDVVTVYRGVTSYNANNIKALSWTLNREVAEWFVHRYSDLGGSPMTAQTM